MSDDDYSEYSQVTRETAPKVIYVDSQSSTDDVVKHRESCISYSPPLPGVVQMVIIQLVSVEEGHRQAAAKLSRVQNE